MTCIAFVGGGNMAKAMVAGLLRRLPASDLIVSAPSPGTRAHFTALGITATADNNQAVAAGDIVVLAVKPQKSAEVLPEVAAAWSSDKLLVSILAGATTVRLAAALPGAARVVRTMPNTPLAIGQGMVGLCGGAHATAADLDAATALFDGCGQVLRVSDESRMDAITAVSGSGPAYFFRMAEALIDAAMALGFTRDEALLLVGTTGAGAWSYLQREGMDAARLRKAVTSPGGTTAAALKVVDDADLTAIWTRALAAARDRGGELSRM